jgi:PAS domain S-box-containing protein
MVQPAASIEQRLALLIDAVEEYAIFLLDPDGIVASWNAGARRIKGYEPEEIIGRHFSVFYDEDDVRAGKPARELADAIEHGTSRDEGWRVRKTGDRFWANVVITALRDEKGEITGFAKVTRDESDRLSNEENLRRLELLTDRERIANELHQSIVHSIFEASLVLQGALRLVPDPAAAGRIHDAIGALDDTLKEIRSVVLDLPNEQD